MKIGTHDTDKKVFIIAELSANHNQDFELAKKGVRVAYEAGCDAVKLQTYTPDSLTLDVKEERFKAGDLWQDEYLYDLYKRACMPYEWHKPLKKYADELGILLFSSPFDLQAVDVLEKIEVPAYKIASFEITDIPLIRYAASKGKPVIISTGVGDTLDIELAVAACKSEGNENIVLLKCTSAYPAAPESMNLLTIADMKERFAAEVGLSDHTLGNDAVIASVALGARVIEKHFTPDENIETPDGAFSLSPSQLREMVQSVRNVEKMLGHVKYDDKSKKYARSLYVSRDIKKGESFTKENIKSIRPGDGLHPKHYEEILGKIALTDIKAGTPLSWENINV
ncbi:pseudaminic acid synthase [Sulfurimonas sp. HSL-1716]|uniref:pseudaminic acid synthase n=1 Tax=Hydrocurvibacter sulfurireducens TaxID=3131937 RepID=UPI0031F7DE28